MWIISLNKVKATFILYALVKPFPAFLWWLVTNEVLVWRYWLNISWAKTSPSVAKKGPPVTDFYISYRVNFWLEIWEKWWQERVGLIIELMNKPNIWWKQKSVKKPLCYSHWAAQNRNYIFQDISRLLFELLSHFMAFYWVKKLLLWKAYFHIQKFKNQLKPSDDQIFVPRRYVLQVMKKSAPSALLFLQVFQ